MNKKTLFGILAGFVLSFVLAAGVAIKFGAGTEGTTPPLPESSQQAASTGAPLLVVKTGNKYGFVDTAGRFVINPQFDWVGPFSESTGLAIAGVGERYGLINKTGAFAVNPQFAAIDAPERGDGYRVLVGDKWGLIDSSGKFLINPQYDDLLPTGIEDRLLAIDGIWARLVDKTGRVLAPHQFAGISEFDPVTGLAGAELDDVVGVLDKDGRFVAGAPDIRWIGKFDPTTRLAPADTDSGAGYVNAAGKFVISPRFDEALRFQESISLAGVRVGDKWGLIDKTGKLVVSPQFEALGSFDPGVGLLPAKAGGRWGFVDGTGRFVVNPQFTEVAAFESQTGLAAVSIGGKGGYIDKTGKIAINPQFDTADDFSSKTGLARVALAAREGFIDTTGKFVINPQFDPIPFDAEPPFWDALRKLSATRELTTISGQYQRYRDGKPDSQLAAIAVSPSEAGMVEIVGMARNSADEEAAAIQGTVEPGRRLRYSEERCKLIMTFTPVGMKVRGYEGDCGGGRGVTFDGTYRKVDKILDTTAAKPRAASAPASPAQQPALHGQPSPKPDLWDQFAAEAATPRGFWILLASLNNPSRSQELLLRAEAATGLTGRLEKRGELTLVLFGPFSTREAAVNVLVQLAESSIAGQVLAHYPTKP